MAGQLVVAGFERVERDRVFAARVRAGPAVELRDQRPRGLVAPDLEVQRSFADLHPGIAGLVSLHVLGHASTLREAMQREQRRGEGDLGRDVAVRLRVQRRSERRAREHVADVAALAIPLEVFTGEVSG